MDGLTGPLTVVAIAGSGLMAGLFLAFSLAVLPALGREPAEYGVAVMRRVNVMIVNPSFLLVFVGTAVLCAALVVDVVVAGGPGAVARLAGAVLYLVGAIGVTAVVHIPLNNALDAPGGEHTWERYLSRWPAWNHLRAATSTASCTAFAVSLLA